MRSAVAPRRSFTADSRLVPCPTGARSVKRRTLEAATLSGGALRELRQGHCGAGESDQAHQGRRLQGIRAVLAEGRGAAHRVLLRAEARRLAEHHKDGTDRDVEAACGDAGLAIWRRGGPRLGAWPEDVNNAQQGATGVLESTTLIASSRASIQEPCIDEALGAQSPPLVAHIRTSGAPGVAHSTAQTPKQQGAPRVPNVICAGNASRGA